MYMAVRNINKRKKKKKPMWKVRKKTQWNQEIKEEQNTLSRKKPEMRVCDREKWRTLILNYPICTTTLSVNTDN